MELLTELVKIVLPGALVLYAMYLTVRAFLNKELIQKQTDLKADYARTLLPIRLQAYERMVLFLERSSPNNLLLRLSGNAQSVLELQQVLLTDLREEFNHNLAQQVYLSNEAWAHIRHAMNEVVATINTAAQELPAEAAPIELSRQIFERWVLLSPNPTDEALRFLKEEVRTNFMEI
ncbi:MAG: hypothetical protein LH606_09685 [Cytophagaceae bacterium]|nr:hypothetical protein [Cytophagaceae bacterium]